MDSLLHGQFSNQASRGDTSRTYRNGRRVPLLFAALSACTVAVAADGGAGTNLPWKLTVGEDAYSSYLGTDVNLRWRSDESSAWAGLYTDPVFGTQARLGADTSVDITKYLQLQPSLQLA